jgi:hypothetical protein
MEYRLDAPTDGPVATKDDARIRRFSVKTATSEIIRPVVKPCLFSDA